MIGEADKDRLRHVPAQFPGPSRARGVASPFVDLRGVEPRARCLQGSRSTVELQALEPGPPRPHLVLRWFLSPRGDSRLRNTPSPPRDYEGIRTLIPHLDKVVH